MPEGCRVSIKGGEEGEAVLCTQNKTFAIKHVETTNTVLLVEVRFTVRVFVCVRARVCVCNA